jgi:prophage regulatory protein
VIKKNTLPELLAPSQDYTSAPAAGTEEIATTDSRAPGEPQTARRMINEKDLLRIIPVARSTLWRMEATGRFPRGVYILPGRKLWYEDEVAAWQAAVDGQFPRRRRPCRKNPKPG